MNEELQKRLMSYLETLEGAVSSTSDFVIEQAPMYAQEIIRWQIAEGIIWCVFFSAISLGFLFLNFTKLRGMRHDTDRDARGNGWGLGVIVIALMIGAIACASERACQSIKAYVSPRVVIIEQLTDIVNPKGP